MKANIKTAIPGPRSIELSKKRSATVANGHGSVSGVFIDKADGSNLIDVDGNVFIDYAGGIGTMNIGHSHPRVLAAIKEQVDKYIHPCFTVAPYELYVTLVKGCLNSCQSQLIVKLHFLIQVRSPLKMQ